MLELNMGHLFYFFGLILVISNMNLLAKFFSFLKTKEWMESFKKITKKEPDVKDFKKTDDLERFNSLNGVLILNVLWLIIGILSKSWKVFLLLLILNYTINLLTHFFGQYKMISKIIQFCKVLILTIFIGLLTINHFHLHLDLFRFLFPTLSTYFPFNIGY